MINWIKSKFTKTVRAASLANPPQWLIDLFSGGKSTASGMVVTPETSLQVAAVYACVRVLSESVASIPLNVYRRLPNGGKEIAKDSTLHNILHAAPNPDMTSFDLRELLMNHLTLRGNHYSQKVIDGAGRVKELWPLHPDRMKIRRTESGALEYEYRNEKGAVQHFQPWEIWRIAGMGANGIVGHSPITLARESIGLSMVIAEHGARTFKNGAQLGGTLETDATNLTEEQVKNLEAAWNNRNAGPENSGKTAVLTGGMKFNTIALSNEDAQFLETRKFQVNEVARIFRVPPHMIADLEKATFSNIEQQGIDFIMHTLRPWLVRIEQTITRDLIVRRHRGTNFAEFDIRGFLRGDSKARSAYYKEGVTNGWFTRNEVRGWENLNPADNLDEFLQPLNMGKAGDDPDPEHDDNAPSAREMHLIRSAASRVVTREINAISKAIEKNEFTEDWVRDFYRDHTAVVADALGVPETTGQAWAADRLFRILSARPADKTLKDWSRLAAEQLTEMVLATEAPA